MHGIPKKVINSPMKLLRSKVIRILNPGKDLGAHHLVPWQRIHRLYKSLTMPVTPICTHNMHSSLQFNMPIKTKFVIKVIFLVMKLHRYRTNDGRHATCLLLLISMLWHRQAIRIERRQVVFLCWQQDSNPSGSQSPNRQQTECPLTNRLSYRVSN